MLMRPPVSDKQESDCETAMDIDEEKPSKQNHDWLLKHLPSLPVFHHIKPHMCNAIRQVRQHWSSYREHVCMHACQSS